MPAARPHRRVLHDAEAALDAVRRKFGNKAAQFGA